MRRPHKRNLIPQIIALRLEGLTHLEVSLRLDCSARHSERTWEMYQAANVIRLAA